MHGGIQPPGCAGEGVLEFRSWGARMTFVVYWEMRQKLQGPERCVLTDTLAHTLARSQSVCRGTCWKAVKKNACNFVVGKRNALLETEN